MNSIFKIRRDSDGLFVAAGQRLNFVTRGGRVFKRLSDLQCHLSQLDKERAEIYKYCSVIEYTVEELRSTNAIHIRNVARQQREAKAKAAEQMMHARLQSELQQLRQREADILNALAAQSSDS